MNAIPRLFERVSHASGNLRVVREGAREKAVQAIRALEHALVEALDGENLKGLREIGAGYQAARVRGQDPFEELPEPKPFESQGREVLVVTSSGTLAMARSCRAFRQGAAERVAEDADLLIEDVQDLGRLFELILGEHIERARKSAETFSRLELLAIQVSEALGR
jgi:hypothetical protein